MSAPENALVRPEVVLYALNEVPRLERNVDEHVQARHRRHVHRHQAAVAVVDEEVGAKGPGAEVIDAAGAVRHIAHHNAVLDAGKPARATISRGIIQSAAQLARRKRDGREVWLAGSRFENVCESAGVEQEPLWKLQREELALGVAQAPDRLVDLRRSSREVALSRRNYATLHLGHFCCCCARKRRETEGETARASKL